MSSPFPTAAAEPLLLPLRNEPRFKALSRPDPQYLR